MSNEARQKIAENLRAALSKEGQLSQGILSEPSGLEESLDEFVERVGPAECDPHKVAELLWAFANHLATELPTPEGYYLAWAGRVREAALLLTTGSWRQALSQPPQGDAGWPEADETPKWLNPAPDVERLERFVGPDGEEYSALNQRERALLEGAVNWERKATEIADKAGALLDALDTAESLAAGGEDQRENVNRVLTTAAADLRATLAAPDVERLGGEGLAEVRAELELRADRHAKTIGIASPESEERARHEEQALRAAISFIDKVAAKRRLGGEEAVKALVQKAIAEFEQRAEGCRELGTHPEPFVYAAGYLRAGLDNVSPPPLEHSKGGLETKCERCGLPKPTSDRDGAGRCYEGKPHLWPRPQPNQGSDQPKDQGGDAHVDQQAGSASVRRHVTGGGVDDGSAAETSQDCGGSGELVVAVHSEDDPHPKITRDCLGCPHPGCPAASDQPKAARSCGGNGGWVSPDAQERARNAEAGGHSGAAAGWVECPGCSHPDCPNRDQAEEAGQCPTCGTTVSLADDGTLEAHRAPEQLSGVCFGTGKEPADPNLHPAPADEGDVRARRLDQARGTEGEAHVKRDASPRSYEESPATENHPASQGEEREQ